jgi:hypothetical protein
MKDKIWRCKNGRMLTVAQMETSHIQNSIAMIERSKNWRKHYLPRLQLELEIRKQGLRP